VRLMRVPRVVAPILYRAFALVFSYNASGNARSPQTPIHVAKRSNDKMNKASPTSPPSPEMET
jgi:hypothetical protein